MLCPYDRCGSDDAIACSFVWIIYLQDNLGTPKISSPAFLVLEMSSGTTIETKVSKKIILNEANLEQRLVILEQTVADLKCRVIDAPASSDWLEKVIGSISDEPAFLEALEYGRLSRHADIFTDDWTV
ncbi:MAG: hypothetical protein RMY28_033655 [Nostoc sp. ChiSLP01]|nr:hypothetical protein [Nostoc sp. CmiSLP01]MDZ8285530.1 hypothetical protein [Nostoc sp. ChiSLP01]